MALSRSTVYYWVRDMPIPGLGPGGGWPTDAQRLGTKAMQRTYRRRREVAYREGLESFDALDAEPTFRDFVALYIAEGYKRNRNCVAICNSNPVVMKLAHVWMGRLAARPLRYSVQFHEDQDSEVLASFWGSELGVPAAAIVTYRKSNSGRLSGRTWRCKHGVLTIVVGDTYFRARLAAWIDQLERQWLDSLS